MQVVHESRLPLAQERDRKESMTKGSLKPLAGARTFACTRAHLVRNAGSGSRGGEAPR